MSTTSSTSKAPKRKRECDSNKVKLIQLACSVLSADKEDDPFVTAGKKIGNDLKELNERQRIIAEKLMNDVMYYAKLGKLNENYSITQTQIQPVYNMTPHYVNSEHSSYMNL